MGALLVASGDLGGSNMRYGVAHCSPGRTEFNSQSYGRFDTTGVTDIEEVLEKSIGRLIHERREKLYGIAIDVAGPVEDHAVLLNAPNIPSLHGKTPFDLRRRIEEMFGLDPVVSNDLEAALAGEVEGGSLQGKEWAMLENIGTGWGGARLYDGVAVAAEPGHLWLPGNDAVCGCGKRGCAEAVLSGGAIRQSLQSMHRRNAICIPAGIDPCAFADKEALRGEPWAVEFYTQIAEQIGNIWGSNLNNCPLMTDIAYMGSFLERAMQIEFFRQEVRASMLARSMFPAQHEKVQIQPVSAPRLDSGEPLGPIIGAASIWNRLRGAHHQALPIE